MEVKAGYKQTEIGVIPNRWKIKRLEDLANIQRGASPRPINSPIWFDQRSSTGWVRISDVTNSHMYLIETTQYLSSLGVKHSRPISCGSIIMSICATVGRPIITGLDVCIHDGFVVFQDLNANRLFMYYILCFIESEWSKHGQTGSQMNLNTGLVGNTLVPIPPENEQKAIAEVLSEADALIASLEKLTEKKRAIKESTSCQLLSGKIRLPGHCDYQDGMSTDSKQTKTKKFPKGWTDHKFSELVTLVTEAAKPTENNMNELCVDLEHIGQGTGLLEGNSTITTKSSHKKRFNKDDVLFGKLRAYLRKYWLADRNGLCSTQFWVFRANQSLAIPQYIRQLVQSERFIESASRVYGTRMPCSDWDVVKQVVYATPSIPEQISICKVLSNMDYELESLKHTLAKAKKIKLGMMQGLLTGKTRLI